MLINCAELHRRLAEGMRLAVIDCRFSLQDPEAGRRAYEAGHIPGAVYFDLEQDLSGPRQSRGGRHPLPAEDELARKLGAAGVGDGVAAVVYDDGGGMAARAWWLIRYLGHDDVWLLDGGFSAWVSAGYPVTAEGPSPRPARFVPRVRHDWVVSVEDVAAAVAGRRPGLLVDARAPERFRGDVEPLDPKAGHIPGAINFPWMDNLGTDGRWLRGEELRERWMQRLKAAGQAGADGAEAGPVVLYCGSGVTACANWFALELAGLSGMKLYPGSWSDWCSRPDLPVATGEGETRSYSQ